MSSYEQTLKLFARWLEEEKRIETVEAITEEVIIAYIVELQQRGKYTCYVNDAAKATNYPMRRRDYRQAVSNTTINNYMWNISCSKSSNTFVEKNAPIVISRPSQSFFTKLTDTSLRRR